MSTEENKKEIPPLCHSPYATHLFGNHATVYILPENTMQLVKSISHAVTAMIEVTSKLFTRTVPEVGKVTFHTVSMASDAVETARLEQLIENKAEVNRILEQANLSDEEVKELHAKLEY